MNYIYKIIEKICKFTIYMNLIIDKLIILCYKIT